MSAQTRASGKKLTKEQKGQVLQLALQSVSSAEIARQMNVDVLRVSGTIRSATNSGLLPAGTQAAPESYVPPSIPPASASPPPLASAAAPPAAQPGSDGYTWTADPSGSAFAHPTQTVKYLVERFAPSNDGLVGSHTSSPSDDEIARKYGHGVYRISKQSPGKMPECREINVSKAFGEPRWPRDAESAPQPQRPGGYPPRPWQRTMPPRGDEDDQDAAPPSFVPRQPFYRRPMPPYEDRERERTLSDFARHSAQGAESVAVTVVDKLSNLQERTLQRMEEQSKRGPDSFVKDFYTQQQDYQHRIATEERQKDDTRRTDEQQRIETRQSEERKRDQERRSEDEDRHRRWQGDQDKRHERDLERIREERKTMMELEDRKLNLIKEESKAREEILRKEIESHRLRIEEIQEASESRIGEMQEQVQNDLKRGRESLDKEHSIREKALDNEHSLKQEMVNIRGEMVKSQGQDDLTKMLTTLVEGVKETIAKVVELKKFEMATPEDRAAQMGQPPGDVRDIPAGAIPASPTTRPPHPPAVASPTKAPGSNGAEATTTIPATLTADAAIQESLKDPMAQHILREWSVTLQKGKDPAMFVNTFMEFMKDETPQGSAGRKASAAFAQLVDNRDWPEMKKLIAPALPPDVKDAFDVPGASDFYNAFRVMVCESIRDYWHMYYAEKRRQAQERQAAQAGAQQQTVPAHQIATPAPAEAPAAPVEAPVETAVATAAPAAEEPASTEEQNVA